MKFLKKIIPTSIKSYLLVYYKIYLKFINKKKIRVIRDSHIEIRNQLRKKNTIKVIFLVIHDSVWKYEKLFELFKNDNRFLPQIIVVPYVNGVNIDFENYKKTLNYFKINNYDSIGSYNEIDEEWIDIKNTVNPDLVFFTNPHDLTFDKYLIYNFNDKLTCYSSYSFPVIHLLDLHYDKFLHKVLWKHFVETEDHHLYLKKYDTANSNNGVVTGFPGLDVIFDEKFKPKQIWKKYSENKTYKIIWAPHHSIAGEGSNLDYSSFMTYSQYFIDLLNKNKKIQIAFKPHPLLKGKLYRNKDWGKGKTDRYYDQWDSLPNGQLEESNYIDLFYLSDAMIHDSASFLAEYLYFDKPVLFTMKDNKIKERFNSFGNKIFNFIYTANNDQDVSMFIENQVLKKDDWMRNKRNKFFKEEILPKKGKTASENIYYQLKKELC